MRWGGWRPRNVWLPLVAVVLGAGAAFVAVRYADDDGGGSAPAADGPYVTAGDVGHVHGLGYSSVDGRWYLATHAGLLRSDPDGLVRIADRYQDTMGFTVIAGDEFLASGHPDLRERLPSSLGLIRSTDAGETWSPVSLSGEADLHAIVPIEGGLLVADASNGTLLRSDDEGRSWEHLADVELASLGADPDDPTQLVGLTYEGATVRSADGGRSFTPVPGPALTSVVWLEEPVAAAPDGAVYELGVAGWRAVGDVGLDEPTLGIGDGVLAAALMDGSLRYSTDGGRTWGSIATAPPPACKPERPSCRAVRR